MLDRLVRGAVLAEADRVVRQNEDAAQADQRRHAQGVARVVGEHEERAAVRNEPAVRSEAVHDGGHAELAHAVKEIVAARVGRRQRLRELVQRVVRAREIGGAAESSGSAGANASSATCEALRVAMALPAAAIASTAFAAMLAPVLRQPPRIRRSNSAASSGC